MVSRRIITFLISVYKSLFHLNHIDKGYLSIGLISSNLPKKSSSSVPMGSQKAAIYAAFVVIGERKEEHQTLNTTTSPRYCLTPVVKQVLHSANSGIFPTA